jgi:hypothetical protein
MTIDEREGACSECGLMEMCNDCNELWVEDATFDGDGDNDIDFEDDDYSYPDGIATQRESVKLSYPDDGLRYCHECKDWEFGPHPDYDYDEGDFEEELDV